MQSVWYTYKKRKFGEMQDVWAQRKDHVRTQREREKAAICKPRRVASKENQVFIL
jgi:hypothetical protein